MAKVLVGMSGGVDSSVTAHLLMQQGFEVEGLSFILWEARNRSGPGACCSLEAKNSASQTAEKLGVSHTALDVRGEFVEKVIEPFAEAYTKGMTPNPCILCNRFVKSLFYSERREKRCGVYCNRPLCESSSQFRARIPELRVPRVLTRHSPLVTV